MTIQPKLIAVILIFGFTIIALDAKENRLSSNATNISNDEKAIRNIIEKQYPGYVNAGDAKGYASQFTKDALWMPPGAINKQGPEDIAKSLNEEFKAAKLSPVVTIQELSVLGNYAYVIGTGDLKIIPKEGGNEMRVVYTVFWFLRKENRQWKIARQIWNEKPIED